MLLHEVFDQRLIKLDLESGDRDGAFFELIDAIADMHPEFDREKVGAIILDRERKLSTAVASGAAIPHGYYPGIDKVVGAIGISKAGVDYDAADEDLVHVIFMLVMGESSREKHLRVLSRVLSLINSGALSGMLAAESPREIHDILSGFN
jgi:mannitol/fructose-specific phosphotransferase system IIA component (Ntr-type)